LLHRSFIFSKTQIEKKLVVHTLPNNILLKLVADKMKSCQGGCIKPLKNRMFF